MHGEHKTNIISRYSAGPSLHGYDPDIPDTDKWVSLTAHMYYPHTKTVGEHGVGGCGRPANPVFNRLSRYEVSFFWEPTNSYISLGMNAGQEAGIDYGHPPYGGPKGNYTCIEGRADWHAYFWITDLDDIWNADEPWAPQPVEWGYLSEHMSVRDNMIKGAYFDPDVNLLYIMGWSNRISVFKVGE